jgi:hypothetical protein
VIGWRDARLAVSFSYLDCIMQVEVREQSTNQGVTFPQRPIRRGAVGRIRKPERPRGISNFCKCGNAPPDYLTHGDYDMPLPPITDRTREKKRKKIFLQAD